MAAKPVRITIGAALDNTLGASVRGAQGQLGRLGSVMSKLDGQHAGVTQMQKLRENANQMGRAFTSAKRRSEELRASLTAAGPPTAAQAREMHKAEVAADKARHALTQQREALRTLKGELQAAGVNTRSLADESVRLGSQLEKLQKRTTALARAQNAQQANRDKRGQMVGDIFGMMAVGTTLAGPAGIAISFEDQMARVGAVSNATQRQVVALTAKAREMGRDTRYSASQAGEGMQYLAMAGFNAQQQIDAIGGVLNVAAAANADLGRTSDIVSNALTGFGLAAGEANRVGDVLTKTFTSSNTTLESLGETLKYVAPVAKAAGANIEFAAAVAGVMGDAGIQGSMAGTAMRSMFTRLVAPAKDAQKHMKQMGITAEQMQEIMADPETQAAAQHIKKMGIQVADEKGNLRDWMDILTELSVKMENLSEQERLAAAAAIFGKPAMSGGLAVLDAMKKDEKYIEEQIANMREQGATEKEMVEYRLKTRNKLHDRYNKNLAASQESFALKVAHRMEDTTGGSLRVLKSATEDLSIEIGKALSPDIRSTADNMAALANKATVLVAQFPVMSRVVLGGAVAALSLGIAWKALGFAWSITKSPWLAAVTQVEKLRAGMALAEVTAGGTVPKFGKVGSALRTLLPSLFSVNAALWANPIVWVGAAMAGAAFLIYKYWEPLSAFFGGLFDGVGAAFAECGMSLGPLGEVFGGIADAIGSAWNWIKELLAPVKLASEEMGIFADAGKNVGFVIGSVVKGAFDAITLPLRGLIEGYKWFKGKIDEVKDESSFEYSVGSGLGMGVVPSGMKAQPVGGRTITNNSKAEIHVTVPPGTDAQGVAEAVRREVERAALYERGREMAGMYD